MSSLVSLVRSISRGYLDNYLNVSSGWGPLVISTGMCCSHLQRFKSDSDIIRGTLALCSSPLKLYFFLTFLLFRLPLVASSLSLLFYLAFPSLVRLFLLLFSEFCFVNVITTVQKKTLFDRMFPDTKFVSWRIAIIAVMKVFTFRIQDCTNAGE